MAVLFGRETEDVRGLGFAGNEDAGLGVDQLGGRFEKGPHQRLSFELTGKLNTQTPDGLPRLILFFEIGVGIGELGDLLTQSKLQGADPRSHRNLRSQLLKVQRLIDKSVGPRFQSADPVASFVARRHDNDVEEASSLLTHLATQLQAVHAGQTPIGEQNPDIGLLL